MVQDPLLDQPGKTFLFEINGRRIFAGGKRFLNCVKTKLVESSRLRFGGTGSNWIPTDHILPMIEESRYRALLELAVSCHSLVLSEPSICTDGLASRSSAQAKGNQNMIRCWGGGVYEPGMFQKSLPV